MIVGSNIEAAFSHLSGFSLMKGLNVFDSVGMFLDYYNYIGTCPEEFDLSAACYRLSVMRAEINDDNNSAKVKITSPLIVIGKHYFVFGDVIEIEKVIGDHWEFSKSWLENGDHKLKEIEIIEATAQRLEYNQYANIIKSDNFVMPENVSGVGQTVLDIICENKTTDSYDEDQTEDIKPLLINHPDKFEKIKSEEITKLHSSHIYMYELDSSLVEKIKANNSGKIYAVALQAFKFNYLDKEDDNELDNLDINYFGNALFITDKDLLNEFSFIITENFVFSLEDGAEMWELLNDEDVEKYTLNARIDKVLPMFNTDPNTMSNNLTLLGFPPVKRGH